MINAHEAARISHATRSLDRIQGQIDDLIQQRAAAGTVRFITVQIPEEHGPALLTALTLAGYRVLTVHSAEPGGWPANRTQLHISWEHVEIPSSV
jgi:hypothetical protein